MQKTLNIKLTQDKIKWISQLGLNADKYNNDCGAASIAMIRSAFEKDIPDVNTIYSTIAQNDRYLSAKELISYLKKQGYVSNWYSNTDISILQKFLSEGKPIIVLFNYKTYRSKYPTDTAFNGSHFAVIAGFDTQGIVLFDPLAVSELYGIVHVDYDHFYNMWTDSNKQGNRARSMLVIEPKQILDENEYQTVKVTTAALRVRLGAGVDKPSANRFVYRGQSFSILETKMFDENNIWIRVTDTEWVAAKHRGVTYVTFA